MRQIHWLAAATTQPETQDDAMTQSRTEQVFNLLTDEMQVPVPAATTDLIDEGLLDSLVFVDLIARLEEAVGIEIDLADLDIDQFRSVEKIAHYLDASLVTSPAEVVA